MLYVLSHDRGFFYTRIVQITFVKRIYCLGQHPSLQGSAKALSTVTAIIDGTGSLGTSASFIVGPLSSNNHWDNVIYLLMAADVCAMILLIRLVKNEMVRLRDRGWKLFVSD